MTEPAQHGAPPRRQNELILLGLAALLVVVAIIAATRGGGARAEDQTAATTGDATNAGITQPTVASAAQNPTAAPSDAGTTGDGSGLDAAVPTVPPLPTATPPRTIDQLPLEGPGTFTGAPASPTTIGAAPYIRFAVASEDGIGVDPLEVAAIVDAVLTDQRSWIGDGVTGFQRVDPDDPDILFTIVVATPTTVDRLCEPLNTASRYSCGRNGWIALNLFRWETAAEVWPSTLEIYRQYLINHEVGHYILGAEHTNTCPVPGGPAPIMMQQSILLDGCAPNGWVYPDE